MDTKREVTKADQCDETPKQREPLFRRYEIKVKAGVRLGPWPIGRAPFF